MTTAELRSHISSFISILEQIQALDGKQIRETVQNLEGLTKSLKLIGYDASALSSLAHTAYGIYVGLTAEGKVEGIIRKLKFLLRRPLVLAMLAKLLG